MDLSADNLKIANLKNALENTAPPSIKVENPEYQELMRRKAVLATGKGKVEKELGTYTEIKGLNQASYKEVQDECSKRETQASDFLQKCRDTLGVVSSVAKDDVQGCLDLKGTVEESSRLLSFTLMASRLSRLARRRSWTSRSKDAAETARRAKDMPMN